MRRRAFIALLSSAAAFAGSCPLGARAQSSGRLRRIGIVLFSPQDRAIIKPFLDEFQRIGYIDGKTVTIEYRDANERYELLPQAAAELARLGPDVIFSFGGEQAPTVKQVTTTIPIVVVVSTDPVASGLVASLARPGGNVTGVTFINEQLAGKSIELLRDALPQLSRVAILWNPEHADPEFGETQRAARMLGIELQSLEVRKPDDFDGAFQAAERRHPQALILLGSRLMLVQRRAIADFAARNRLPVAGTARWVPEDGGLLSYGANRPELIRKAAGYVDKILKGARPSDLP